VCFGTLAEANASEFPGPWNPLRSGGVIAPMRRFRVVGSGFALVVLALVGIAVSTSGAARTTTVFHPSRAAKTCPVTVPNGLVPPSAPRTALPPVPPVFDGNGELWVKLWPLGVIVARPVVVTAKGLIDIKLPWWRGVPGRLTITGRRLDAPAPPLKSDVPAGYGDTGFQATGVIFPTQGCWRVTGQVGTTRLVFVTLVVKPKGNGY
jgi:hypothetical protein